MRWSSSATTGPSAGAARSSPPAPADPAAERPHLSYLVLDALSRSYGAFAAVRDVSLTVPRGSLVALLGPSGCGKTTTLRIVAGLETPDSGRVLVDGRDVTRLPPYARRMGVVFQSYALFPHMTVQANVAFGLRMQRIPGPERTRRAASALGMVGLADQAHKRPQQLSGGQQQRVAVARALAIEPEILLLDEPLSALDAKLREELRIELRILQRRVGATTVFVTHDQAEALAMADLVAVMQAGRIAQLGTPEDVFERPATPFVAEFVGRSARFQGIAGPDGIHIKPSPSETRLVEGLTPGTRSAAAVIRATCSPGPAQIFIRPHRLAILTSQETADNMLEGVVAALDYTGEVVQVVVDTPIGRVPVDISTRDATWRALQPGQPARVGWAAKDTLCFPA